MEQAPTVASNSPSWSTDPRTYIILGSTFFLLTLLSLLFKVSLLIPIVGVFGIVAIVMLFRAPLELLAGLIVLRMSLDYSSQYLSFTFLDRIFSLSQILGLGIALLGILFILFRLRELGRYPLTLPYGLILIWGLSTVSYSIFPSMSLQESLRIFDLFVVGFIAYAAVTRYRDYRFLLMAIFFSSLLPILFGLYQFTFNIGLSDENVSAIRIFGTFSHPNVFSLYLFTVAAVASIYFLVYARKDNARFFTALYIGFVLVTLLLTYARIAWIALFVFAVLVALWRYRVLLVPIILLPLVLTVFIPAVQERVIEALHPTPDSSIVWRKNLWHDMMLKTDVEDRKLLGSGIDTFRVSAESLRGERFGSNESHNDFVKFYVEGGIVGVIIFLLYIVFLMYPILHIRHLTPSHSLKNGSTLILLFLITLVIASFSDNVFKNTPVQWILSIVLGGFLSLYHASLPKDLREA